MWYAAPDLSVKSYILNLEIILVSISVCQSVIVDITTRLGAKVMEADKDHLITEDGDAAYRKCPGVNNVAYVVSRAEESWHLYHLKYRV